METAASFEARNAPSSYPTEADDARTWEVGLCRNVAHNISAVMLPQILCALRLLSGGRTADACN
jgi:hypothetical protein